MNVSSNQLVYLDLSNCNNLKELDCSHNSLTKLDLNPQAKLEKLDINDNDFSETDLSFFEWIKQGFSSKEVKEWTKVALTFQDSYFCAWLKNSKQLTSKQVLGNEQQLREECDNASAITKQWLKQNYPNKETLRIYINQQLEGVLDCSEYKNLWEIFISSSVDSSKFEIKKSSYYGGFETKIISCIPTQTYLNQEYPTLEAREEAEELDTNKDLEGGIDYLPSKGLEGNLDLSNFKNLKVLDCKNNFLTNLNLNNCRELRNIDCGSNQLATLNLSDLEQLKVLDCSNNYLTQIIYPANLEKIFELNIINNNFLSQDLTIFSQFRNLRDLHIGNHDEDKIDQGIYNRFHGSLEPLKNLNKLETLNISNTDIDRGLEYLSRSIDFFWCDFDSRLEARVSDIWDELNPFEGKDFTDKLKKWREIKIDKKLPLTISPLLPPQLINEIKLENKIWENNGVPNLDYEKIYLNFWNTKLSPTSLFPTKLYNIKESWIENFSTKEVIDVETREVRKDAEPETNVEYYAILSYVWGDPKTKTHGKMKEKMEGKEGLTILGNKVLYKAVNACKCEELKEIKHVWLDQLCIDQGNDNEKIQEVSKMRQYYSNASVTLISINTELGDLSNIDLVGILKLIVNSQWFTRSWTFQEGWLSKHTIFMFDDKLIDGQAMAGIWALNQLGYANEGRYLSRREFQKGTKKIATPVGWVYYRDGYDKSDEVEITLGQALKEIKNRKRSIPVDGIYSILGLLPYGKHVKVKYNPNNRYTQEELNQTLYEVMKVAIGYRKKIKPADYILNKEYPNFDIDIIETLPSRKVIEYEDYEAEKIAEPIAWYGISNIAPGFCWMPQIDEHGSTSVEGGVSIKASRISFGGDSFREEGIELGGIHVFSIVETDSNIHKLEGGFEIEGGLYQKGAKTKKKDEDGNETGEIIKVPLIGTQRTLELAEKGKYLVVFDREEWQSDKPFALLVGWYGREIPIYHRLGLVELGNEKLQASKGSKLKKIIISGNSPNTQLQTNQIELNQEYQSHQEIPPKGDL